MFDQTAFSTSVRQIYKLLPRRGAAGPRSQDDGQPGIRLKFADARCEVTAISFAKQFRIVHKQDEFRGLHLSIFFATGLCGVKDLQTPARNHRRRVRGSSSLQLAIEHASSDMSLRRVLNFLDQTKKLVDMFAGQRRRNQDGRIIHKEEPLARKIDNLINGCLRAVFWFHQIKFIRDNDRCFPRFLD